LRPTSARKFSKVCHLSQTLIPLAPQYLKSLLDGFWQRFLIACHNLHSVVAVPLIVCPWVLLALPRFLAISSFRHPQLRVLPIKREDEATRTSRPHWHKQIHRYFPPAFSSVLRNAVSLVNCLPVRSLGCAIFVIYQIVSVFNMGVLWPMS